MRAGASGSQTDSINLYFPDETTSGIVDSSISIGGLSKSIARDGPPTSGVTGDPPFPAFFPPGRFAFFFAAMVNAPY